MRVLSSLRRIVPVVVALAVIGLVSSALSPGFHWLGNGIGLLSPGSPRG